MIKHSQSDRIFLWGFVGLGIYFAIGFYPFAPVFGDGIGIANGAMQMAEVGLGPTPVAYRFSQAPGIYALLTSLHKLTGADTHNIFLLLSALSAVVFVIFSALLVARLTGAPVGLAGIVLLLFQETSAAGYYANTNVVAGAFCVAGLYFVARQPERIGQLALAGCLLGLGAFLRVDAIFLTPVVLPLLYRGNVRDMVVRTVPVAIVTAIIFSLAYIASGARFEELFAAISDKSALVTATESGHFVLKTHIAYFSALLIFLMVVGVLDLAKKRHWHLLMIAAVGILPIYTVFPAAVDVPRFLYPYTPFFAILAVQGIWRTQPENWPLRFAFNAALVLMFAGQYVLGLNHYPLNVENDFLRKPFRFVTSVHTDATHRLGLKIGPGLPIMGAGINGGHLSSGWLFSPTWHVQQKMSARKKRAELDAFLRSKSAQTYDVHVMGWTAASFVRLSLLRQNYQFRGSESDVAGKWSSYRFEKDGEVVTQIHYRYRAIPDILAGRSDNPVIGIDKTGSVLIMEEFRNPEQLLSTGEEDWRRIGTFAFEYEPRTGGQLPAPD